MLFMFVIYVLNFDKCLIFVCMKKMLDGKWINKELVK